MLQHAEDVQSKTGRMDFRTKAAIAKCEKAQGVGNGRG